MNDAKEEHGYNQRKVICIDCGGSGVTYPQHSVSKVPVRCRTCRGVGFHLVAAEDEPRKSHSLDASRYV